MNQVGREGRDELEGKEGMSWVGREERDESGGQRRKG